MSTGLAVASSRTGVHRGVGRALGLLLVAVAMVSGCALPGQPSEAHALDPAGLLASAPPGCIASWQPQKLPGKRHTRYVAALADDGRPMVRAEADRSASMLRHRLRIEPSRLGQLSFSWQVAALIDGADVRDRDVEDSPARLVLAFDGDAAQLSERDRLLFDLAETLGGERPPFATLMYVWDAQAPLGSVVVSSRTSRVRKIVVDSGATGLGDWRQHRRDVAADYRLAYGEPPGALVGVALMTDADNTATRAGAAYGPVCLSGSGADAPQP